MPETPKLGTIGWVDLTVADAERVRDFYGALAGWTPAAVAMDGYDDYSMVAAATGEPAAARLVYRAASPIAWMGPSVSQCVEINVRM